jgi:AcrR family transcriptional regulator
VDDLRPRRQSPDVRREQILDAAQRVLLERGLRATTVADVVDAAGVAKGTMYLYFRSKDELLAGLRARYLDDYSRA